MDKGAWWATVHGVSELDMTEAIWHNNNNNNNIYIYVYIYIYTYI